MDLSSDLYVLLINFLDGDMMEPYLQGGPSSFSLQGIAMLQDLVNTHPSSSSAGLVSILTCFLQACKIPMASVVQCYHVRGLTTELDRLGQPIAESLFRLLVIHGLTSQLSDLSGQVATSLM
jgi:hypothetical protein